MGEAAGPEMDPTGGRLHHRGPRPHRALLGVPGLTVLVGLVGLAVFALLALSPARPDVAGQAPDRVAARVTPSTPSIPLTVVGLGDSVPAATTCGCSNYVEQVGARLGILTSRPPVVHNDAIDGWTTPDVAESLRTPPTREHVADADLVILQVGANDFDLSGVGNPACLTATSHCFDAAVETLRTNLTDVIDGVHAIDHRPDHRIAVLGYWNVTVDGVVGQALGEDFVVGSDQLTRSVNATIKQVAVDTGSVYVDAYTPLKGEDSAPRDPTSKLLDDGDHLNATGHAILATAVVDTLDQSGALASWGP